MSLSTSRMRRLAPIAAAAAVLTVGLGTVRAADLTVEVLGARSAQGSVAGALFAGGQGWLKPGQAVQGQFVPASDKVVLLFRGLAPGRYAVSLYHDENGNAKLDANVVGLPTEPYGFSRDAQGRMGPPAFDDAAVDVQADTAVTVRLR